jgi:hypothetical protein
VAEQRVEPREEIRVEGSLVERVREGAPREDAARLGVVGARVENEDVREVVAAELPEVDEPRGERGEEDDDEVPAPQGGLRGRGDSRSPAR